MNVDLKAIRSEYARAGLHERDVDPSPLVQLEKWLQAAISAQHPEPTAMTLATSTPPAPAPPPTATPAPVPLKVAPVPAPRTSPPTQERAPATARGQISQIPSGAPDTGGGSTAGDTEMVLVALGMLGLTGAAGLGGALARRRPRDTAQD